MYTVTYRFLTANFAARPACWRPSQEKQMIDLPAVLNLVRQSSRAEITDSGERSAIGGRCESFRRNLARKWVTLIGMVGAIAVSASVADARPRQVDTQSRHASSYDGRWSLVVETERGACDRSYRVGVDIIKGAITYDGNAYGRVSTGGAVRVAVSVGNQHAQGAGRLSRGAGRGVWSGQGNAGTCSGRWIAERRD
jgi:hypothetical protein